MQSNPDEQQALQRTSELELPLGALEARLASLAQALREHDPSRIEAEAGALQKDLSTAMDRFALALRTGPLPAPLRERLIIAGGQVAAQREALARATASLDRAIDVLMPSSQGRLYAAGGARSISGLSDAQG